MTLLKPGNESSEYWKALRAEVLGVALVLVGVVVALLATVPLRAGVGLALVAVGGAILTKALGFYAAARSDVKAAAVRRPVDTAPRGGL